MKYNIKSKVKVMGLWMTAEHQQEFKEDSNVFGRVLEYHQYMYKTFPNCEFTLVRADQVKEGEQK